MIQTQIGSLDFLNVHHSESLYKVIVDCVHVQLNQSIDVAILIDIVVHRCSEF